MNARLPKLGLDIYTALIALSVALALVGLSNRMQGDPGTSKPQINSTKAPPTIADPAPVLALAPFGTAGLGAEATGSTAFRLRAIFLSVPPQSSTFLAEGADGKVVSYGIGDTVGGGRIAGIEADRVLVRTPSGLMAVTFQPSGEGGSAPGLASAEPLPAAPSSPASAASQPASEPAQPAGLKIGQKPLPALSAAGIKPGDVVARVNGTALTQSSRESDVFARASTAGVAEIEIIRDGRRLSLTVPIR